jgi:hypothetical protein
MDSFSQRRSNADQTVTAYDIVELTPSDSVSFDSCVALYIGADGTIDILTNKGRTVTGIPVFAGQVFECQCTKLLAATTASPVYAMYN